ncbi:MAG: hypothetical protein HKM02_00385, partial [Pseudomonadales bacterium]|nr:hypothetical protein [Pseudomonadales bacterium]
MLCTLALGLQFILTPEDPMGSGSSFPWIWMAPLLLALRYGSVAAVSASSLFGIYALVRLPFDHLASQGSPLLGGWIVSLVAGEFSDLWGNRIKRLQSANGYFTDRLSHLTRRHFLLRLSHERLEQDLLIKPITLRDSLTEMRRHMREYPEDALPAVAELMHVLTQACQLEAAAIHQVQDGKIDPVAVTQRGLIEALVADDPMIVQSLQRQELLHLQSDPAHHDASRYMVVAPLANSRGVLGILRVEKMPFLSMNLEIMQFMTVLLGYYADLIDLQPEIAPLSEQWPQLPTGFIAELLRLARIQREASINSYLVSFVFTDTIHGEEMHQEAARQGRELDLNVSLISPQGPMLLTLMPLFGQAAAAGYLLRIEKRIQEIFGHEHLSEAGIL